MLLGRSLSVTSILGGALSALAAQTLSPTTDGSPSPVVLLSLGSLVSIGLGFYWYGRLTERVRSEQERRETIEHRLDTLERTATEPRIIERMADNLQALTGAVIQIQTRLNIDSHDLANTSNKPYTGV